MGEKFGRRKILSIFALAIGEVIVVNKIGEYSSAGSEHLPYKQRVRGSNPCAPTLKDKRLRFLS